jgi:hypothetical protein
MAGRTFTMVGADVVACRSGRHQCVRQPRLGHRGSVGCRGRSGDAASGALKTFVARCRRDTHHLDLSQTPGQFDGPTALHARPRQRQERDGRPRRLQDEQILDIPNMSTCERGALSPRPTSTPTFPRSTPGTCRQRLCPALPVPGPAPRPLAGCSVDPQARLVALRKSSQIELLLDNHEGADSLPRRPPQGHLGEARSLRPHVLDRADHGCHRRPALSGQGPATAYPLGAWGRKGVSWLSIPNRRVVLAQVPGVAVVIERVPPGPGRKQHAGAVKNLRQSLMPFQAARSRLKMGSWLLADAVVLWSVRGRESVGHRELRFGPFSVAFEHAN